MTLNGEIKRFPVPCSIPTYKGHVEAYNLATTEVFARFNPGYAESDYHDGSDVIEEAKNGTGDDDVAKKAIFFMYQTTDEIHFNRQRVMEGMDGPMSHSYHIVV